MCIFLLTKWKKIFVFLYCILFEYLYILNHWSCFSPCFITLNGQSIFLDDPRIIFNHHHISFYNFPIKQYTRIFDQINHKPWLFLRVSTLQVLVETFRTNCNYIWDFNSAFSITSVTPITMSWISYLNFLGCRYWDGRKHNV